MSNILIISDLHIPYHHRDAFNFLKAVRDEFFIDEVKNVGDVTDNHTASFHEIEYRALSPVDEYKRSRAAMQDLSDIFPDMVITLGNHCNLSKRKAKAADIPEDWLKSHNDIYGVDWKWVDKDYFRVDKTLKCLMVHSMSGNTLTNAKTHSHCSVQGHWHGVYGIEYFADTEVLRWAMTVGCLIDPRSPAFNYAKGSTQKRPILGCGVILDGLPILIPMRLNKNGRWIKKLPKII